MPNQIYPKYIPKLPRQNIKCKHFFHLDGSLEAFVARQNGGRPSLSSCNFFPNLLQNVARWYCDERNWTRGDVASSIDTFSNNNRVRWIENERHRRRKRSSRIAETSYMCTCVCVCMCVCKKVYVQDRSFLPLFARSRSRVNRPRRAYGRWTTGRGTLALACTRVTADQEHVTLVAHAYRFRWIRQGCGVVAASVAEDLAAVSTVVLEQKWLMW